jgi:hypothetical protein
MNIKKILNWSGKTAAALTALILFICLAAYVTLLLPPVQQRVLRIAESQLHSYIVGKVTIGKLRSNLLSRIDIYDFKMKDSSGCSDSIYVGHIRVRYSFASLLRKRIHVYSLFADHVNANLYVTSKGKYMIPALPKKPRNTKLDWRNLNLYLKVNRIMIRNLNGRYTDSMLNMRGVIENGKIWGKVPKIDSIVATLSIPQVLYESPWWTGRVKSVKTDVEIDPDGLSLANTSVSGSGSEVLGGGRIPFAVDGRWDLHADVKTDIKPVLAVHTLVPGLFSDKGHANVSASWKGTFQNPQLSANLKSSGIEFRGFMADSFSFKGDYNVSGLLSARGNIKTEAGSVAFQTTISIPGLFTGPVLKKYSAAVQTKQIIPGKISQLQRLCKVFPDAALAVQGSIQGTGPDSLPQNVSLNLSASDKVIGDKQLEVQAGLKCGEWNLSTSLGDNTISAGGKIISISKKLNIEGTASAKINQPSLLSGLIFKENVNGSIALNASINGDIKNIKGILVCEGSHLIWRNVQADSVFARINFAKDNVLMEDVYVHGNANLKSLIKRKDLESLNGLISVRARASGPLLTPSVTASISGSAIHYLQYGADTLAGEIAVSGLDSIRWNNLHIRSGKTSVSSSGEFSIKSISGDASILVKSRDRKGNYLNNGTVQLKGSMVKDSFQLDYESKGLEIASLSPWTRLDTLISGKLDVKGRLDGTTSNPHNEIVFGVKDPSYQKTAIASVSGKLSLADSLLSGTISLYSQEKSSPLVINARLFLRPSMRWQIDGSGSRPSEVNIDCNPLDLKDVVQLLGTDWKAEGPLRLHVNLSNNYGNIWKIQGRTQIKNGHLSNQLQGIDISQFDISTGVSGSLENPQFAFMFKSSNIKIPDGQIDRCFIRGLSNFDTLEIDTASFRLPQDGLIRLSGTIPIRHPDSIFLNPGLFVNYTIHKLPLLFFSPLYPENFIKGGILKSQGVLKVAHNRPVLFGKGSVEKAEFNIDGVEPSAGPFDVEFTMNEDSLYFQKINGKMGNGALNAKGIATWTEKGGIDKLKFDIKGKDLSFNMPDLAQVRVQSVNLQLNNRRDGYVLSGTIDLGDTRITRDLKLTDLFGQMNPVYSSLKEPDPFLNKLGLELNVNLQENLTIDMNLGYMVLDGKLGVGGTEVYPNLYGDIKVTEGYVLYLDRKFDIIQGSFYNPDPYKFNPILNVQAQTEVFSNIEDNPFTINLTVSGDLESPVLHLSEATGAWDEANIISILTLGQPIGAVGNDLGNRIRNFAAQSIAGFGARKLEQLLRLERVNLSGDIFSSQGQTLQNSRLSVTKRITPRLLVSYETAISDFKKRNLSALFRLTRNLFIKGNNDNEQGKESGLDLIFRYSK